MAFMAASSRKALVFLFVFAILATGFGVKGNINFVSMETYRGPDRGFELSIFDLVAWALFLKLIFKNFRQIVWVPYNFYFFLLMFSISIISSFQADGQIYAMFSLFKFIRVFFIYLIFYNLFIIEDLGSNLWYGMAALALVFTFIGLKQKYIQGIYRIPCTFDHSNTVPLYLNMMIPAMIIWPFADLKMPAIKAVSSILLAFGMLFCVIATFSRAGTAFAGLAIISVMVAGLFRWRSGRAVLISSLIVIAGLVGGAKAAGSFIERIKSAPESSEAARDEFNAAADAMMRDHFFGVGLNNFSKAMTDREEYQQFVVVMANEEQAGVCHHIYRLMGAETGIIGLTVFIIIILRFTWAGIWNFFRLKGQAAALGLAISAGFFALHLSGFFEWAFRLTPVMSIFAILSAFSVTLEHSSLNQKEDEKCP
ncbi:MAG: O-antigen ligase family protein [Candidatus Rifleibacteriota bacterium]